MIRKRRKTRKYRGSRVHGFGRVGQHRKAGMRGGKGWAGKNKHLKSGLTEAERATIGSFGFKRPVKLRKPDKSINISKLEELIETLPEDTEGVQFSDQSVEIDVTLFGYNKILGGGKITRIMNVKAYSFSEKAIEK
ncbi:uL15 family ribosomal protein, partial [Candidatus Borrarchaeum sp.]|uniref:uL15 family ribosomal protein n=1 Tax=Candidatus Borrarchaeum sp. TaxID=2846742 RepID=UPI002580E02B